MKVGDANGCVTGSVVPCCHQYSVGNSPQTSAVRTGFTVVESAPLTFQLLLRRGRSFEECDPVWASTVDLQFSRAQKAADRRNHRHPRNRLTQHRDHLLERSHGCKKDHDLSRHRVWALGCHHAQRQRGVRRSQSPQWRHHPGVRVRAWQAVVPLRRQEPRPHQRRWAHWSGNPG